MNARMNLWKLCALAMVFALALMLVATRESSWALAHDNDDEDGDGQPINLRLPSAGIVYGESLRTTLTNYGKRSVTVRPTLVDADGVVVKEAAEPLVVEPGQMRSFEVSRAEVDGEVEGGERAWASSSSGQSLRLRPMMTMRTAEAKNVAVRVEVIDSSTGSTRFAPPGGCDDWGCGTNHNETMVRDTSPLK